MKIGLLFAGQGAQHPGMGKSLYENSEAARKVMDIAGEEIKEWCFNGTKEMLRQTHITQPCIYTVTMAAYEALTEEIEKLIKAEGHSITVGGMAGFSLGEYAALTAGKVIGNIQVGLEIVKERGRLMSEAGNDKEGQPMGGMTAAFGDRERVLFCAEEARGSGILECVNFNSPTQTVVAGDKDALSRFRTVIKTHAKQGEHLKAVPLSVSTAFHSSMMAPAVPKLKELLLNSSLAYPEVKIYSNVTGIDMMAGFAEKENLTDGEAVNAWIAELVGDQAKSPVYWQETIENMIDDGIEVFIEIGPGSTLSGLVNKINHNVITMNVADKENLDHTIAELNREIKEGVEC